MVVCDRRACGKETQRASEVALQFATETLNTLAQHTHAHTHRAIGFLRFLSSVAHYSVSATGF